MTAKKGFIPGSDADSEEIFQYPFTMEDETTEYLQEHGHIMFIIRGPPGTGKDSLAAMLSSKDKYPNAVVCSANDYFDKTFSNKVRDRKSLADSHEYCKKRVETSCLKDVHPIIVKNTHVKRSELQNYLNLAAEYNYTVIIASTLTKFIISPDILAESNTKGLSKEYFINRMKHWQEVYPVVVGWFISPGDSSHIIADLQTSLDHLLGDGKFCRIFDTFDLEKLLEVYNRKRTLYCTAACSKNNDYFDLMHYYTEKIVKEHYGQCFTLKIQGFLVTTSNVCAIVELDETMKSLNKNSPMPQPSLPESNTVDDLALDFDALKIHPKYNPGNMKKYHQNLPFNEKLPKTEGSTASVEQWLEGEAIDVNSCSCILLAVKKYGVQDMPWSTKLSFYKNLMQVADSNGFISSEQFGELEDSYKFCRLPQNAWIVKPQHKIVIKSVFTGMYT